MSQEKSNQESTTPETQRETEELNFETPSFSFIPPGVHSYRQHGYYLVCKSCEIEHAIWIGSKHLLTGFDSEGKPILKRRSELGMA